MNPIAMFIISTVAGWSGLVLIFVAMWNAFQLIVKTPGLNEARAKRTALLNCVLGIALLVISGFTPTDAGRPIEGEGVRVPVLWFHAPFWGWMMVIGIIAVVSYLIQAYVALTEDERKSKLIYAGGAGFTALLSGGLFRAYQGEFIPLRGVFYLSPLTIGVALGLITVSLAAMAWLSMQTVTKQRAKTFWTHVSLLLGCVIFGLPFAWLLSGSFKEDKDLTGGIIWIPRVTQRVDYFDPKDRQFEINYEGQKVTASLIEKLPGDRGRFDVISPIALRGRTSEELMSEVKEVPKQVPVVEGKLNAVNFKGKVIEELETGNRKVEILEPPQLKGQVREFSQEQIVDLRPQGLRWQNYPESLNYLPPETNLGLKYLYNTVLLVVLSVIGTILSCAIVAYAFSRMSFPGRELLFKVLLATMMLPGAVTLMPQFLIFKQLGWIDTLYPLWVPSFFAGAFNVFLLRQFFSQIPMELEDAAKIDGAGYFEAFWKIMLPQVRPALAVVAIWTLMGTWNNFMGPLIYINSPENMPIAYALQLFNGERSGEPGLLMAFATLSMLPVLLIFFFAQKYFIEGVTLSGLGGR